MTDDELRESIEQAKALTAMRPPRNVALVLEQYRRELLKEISNRPDIKVSENTERQPAELTDSEVAEAIDRATVLRSMKPRYGVQVILGEYLLALMLEQSRRSFQER